MTVEESMQAVINSVKADVAKMDAEIEALREDNGALQVQLANAQDEIATLTATANKVLALQRIAAELNAELWQLRQQAARDGVVVSGGFKGATE